MDTHSKQVIEKDYLKLLNRLSSLTEDGEYIFKVSEDEKVLIKNLLVKKDFDFILKKFNSRNFKKRVSVLSFYDAFKDLVTKTSRLNFLDLIFSQIWNLDVDNNNLWHPWRGQFDPEMNGDRLFIEGFVRYQIGINGFVTLDATNNWWETTSKFLKDLKSFLEHDKFEQTILEFFESLSVVDRFELNLTHKYDFKLKPSGKKLCQLKKLLLVNIEKKNLRNIFEILSDVSGLKKNEFENINLVDLVDGTLSVQNY